MRYPQGVQSQFYIFLEPNNWIIHFSCCISKISRTFLLLLSKILVFNIPLVIEFHMVQSLKITFICQLAILTSFCFCFLLPAVVKYEKSWMPCSQLWDAVQFINCKVWDLVYIDSECLRNSFFAEAFYIHHST